MEFLIEARNLDLRFFKYPWRTAFEDLSESNSTMLPVASGASCLVPNGVLPDLPFPRRVHLNGRNFQLYEIPDTDHSQRISIFSWADQRLFASSEAYGGLGADSVSDLGLYIEESLQFIQRLEDIVKGEKLDDKTGIPRVSWTRAIKDLIQTDWRGATFRKPLIVSLAEKQMFGLRKIERSAKKILRRKRGIERLSKAREFDKESMIRIAQLPGRNVAEKAGPRQRIPAVLRYESTDTLENRVVEHFCRLAQDEWSRTKRSYQTSISNDREELALRFVRLCGRVRTNDEIRSISKLNSPCLTPNFTLEQNPNYRSIWTGYQRLLKREQEREECWAWARRLFLNRAFVFAAELFEKVFDSKNSFYLPYAKRLRIAVSHRHGLWLETQSLPGPRVIEIKNKNEEATAYMLSPSEVVAGFREVVTFLECNADAYYLSVQRKQIKVCPVYAFVGGASDQAFCAAATDLSEVYERLSNLYSENSIQLQTPILIWADFLRPQEYNKKIDSKLIHQGIPVINDHWVSPTQSVIDQTRRAFLS